MEKMPKKIIKQKIHTKTELGIVFDNVKNECPKCHSKSIHDIDYCDICGITGRECLECGCTWQEWKKSK